MLPDVKLAFEIVDGYFASGEPSAITDAWEILKTAVLAQQTTNTQIMPVCPHHDIITLIQNGKPDIKFDTCMCRGKPA
jgi:hypothetical protein